MAKIFQPAPLPQESRSKLLASVLDDMKERNKRPDPRTWGETFLRAAEGGLDGMTARKRLVKAEAKKAKGLEMLADILSLDDEKRAASYRR